MSSYQPTSSLPDAEGEALLKELWRLYSVTCFNEETGKKVRRGSNDERWAIAELLTAIVKAAARFERHEEFTAWLGRNDAESIEAYDPIRGRTEQANAIRDLQWQFENIKDDLKGLNEMYRLLVEDLLKRSSADRKAASEATL